MTRNRSITVLALLVSILHFASGCKSLPLSDSNLKHEEGELAQPYPAFIWKAFKDEDFVNYAQSKIAPIDVLLPDSSAMSLRIQEMIDAADKVMRQHAPDRMRRIPKPKVAVVGSETPAAYVLSSAGCVKQSFRFEGKLKSTMIFPDPNRKIVASLTTSGYGSEYQLPLPPANDSSARLPSASTPARCTLSDPESIGWDPEFFVRNWNERLPSEQSQCRLTLKDGVIVASEDGVSVDGKVEKGACVKAWNFTQKELDAIEFSVVANSLFFHSKLIKNLSEASLAVVVNHELGHYYRAHTSNLTTWLPFFFQHSPENDLRKPEVTTNHMEIQKALLALKGLKSDFNVPGASMDQPDLNELSIILDRKIVGAHCFDKLAACNAAYAAYSDFSEKQKAPAFANYLGDKMTSAQIALWKKHEVLLLKLYDSVDLSKIDGNLKEEMDGLIAPSIKSYFEPLAKSKDFGLWFRSGAKRVKGALPQMKLLYQNAAALGLGYYTSEEEADEIGYELSARLGINQAQAERLWVEFAKLMDVPDTLDTPMAECSAKADAYLKDPANSGFPDILLKNIENIHHGFCYRLYNLKREWKAHDLNRLAPATPLLTFNQAKWSKLVASMEADVAKIVGGTSASNVSKTQQDTTPSKPISPQAVKVENKVETKEGKTTTTMITRNQKGQIIRAVAASDRDTYPLHSSGQLEDHCPLMQKPWTLHR